jgi:protoheme IX farnesyltransferase
MEKAAKVSSAWSTFAHSVESILVLFKLRVVGLLVLSSLGGALLASGGTIRWESLLLLIVSGTLSAAGASALNQYLERESDAQMKRTRRRPLAVGGIPRSESVLHVGLSLIVIAVLIALPFNLELAFFVAMGALIYVGVYTVWLKPRTVLNIVIGGAAGSCAVLSGSAAAGQWAHPTAVALAGLVFVWTPIHFWSLAQAYRDDYARVNMPMLPVLISDRASARWIALHAGAAAVSALAMIADETLGAWYAIPVLAATAWLVWHTVQLLRTPTGAQAFRLFLTSNIYLTVVLLAIFLGTLF